MESLLISGIHPIYWRDYSPIILSCLYKASLHSAYASRYFLAASVWWLNGDELADTLGLGCPSLYCKALVAGQCMYLRVHLLHLLTRIWTSGSRRFVTLGTLNWRHSNGTGTLKDLVSCHRGGQDPWSRGRDEFRLEIYPKF